MVEMYRYVHPSVARSELERIVRDLGYDPGDVVRVEFSFEHERIIVERILRNADGRISMDHFGARTRSTSHEIVDDVGREAAGDPVS